MCALVTTCAQARHGFVQMAVACAIAFSVSGCATPPTSAYNERTAPGAAGAAYPNMPTVAPIGVRIGKYMEVAESARGPAIDPAKGYRLQDLGGGLYMITDNIYQSLFMTYDSGVVVIDAPPTYAAKISAAIAEVTDKPITHIVYSHSHKDHIGGSGRLGDHPVIIAHEATKALLERAHDPNRPLPSVTFSDRYTLRVGSKTLELSYHGVAHAPGNIFIYAPAQRTLMVVDVVFPGWMPFRRLALAQDVDGYFAQVEEIKGFDFDTLVAGHVERTGTHADVTLQSDFMNDLRAAMVDALAVTKAGDGLDARDATNPWAYFDSYFDRAVIACVNTLTPLWSKRLAGFDVYIWDQCYVMEETLALD